MQVTQQDLWSRGTLDKAGTWWFDTGCCALLFGAVHCYAVLCPVVLSLRLTMLCCALLHVAVLCFTVLVKLGGFLVWAPLGEEVCQEG